LPFSDIESLSALTLVTCFSVFRTIQPCFKERATMKKAVVAFVLFVASTSFAQLARPTVYIEPQQGFETYLAAAMSKKNVPVDVVTDPAKATYVLKTAPVEIQKESTGGKVVRCLFAYCAGIEDKGTVSVQL